MKLFVPPYLPGDMVVPIIPCLDVYSTLTMSGAEHVGEIYESEMVMVLATPKENCALAHVLGATCSGWVFGVYLKKVVVP